MKRISLFILLLSLCTSTLYVLPSGLPQATDLLLFVAIIAYGDLVKVIQHGFKKLPWITVFTAYAFIREIVAALQYDTNIAIAELFATILFIPFNYLVCAYIYYLISTKAYLKFKKYIFQIPDLLVLGLSTALAINSLIIIRNFGLFRSVGGFNSPNQLAAFCSYTSAVFLLSYVIGLRYSFIKNIFLFSFANAQLGVLFSLSKAAMFSNPVYYLFFLRKVKLSGKFIQRVLSLLIVLTIIIIPFYSRVEQFSSSVATQFERAVDRAENLDSEDDSDLISGRRVGLLSLLNEVELFVGVGETHHGRRYSFYDGKNQEIHSTFPQTIFTRGIIGVCFLALFILDLVINVKNKSNRFVIVLALLVWVLYGITHYSLRDTGSWFLFALAKATADMPSRHAKKTWSPSLRPDNG